MKEITNRVKNIGLVIPGINDDQCDKNQMVDYIENLINAITKLTDVVKIESSNNNN